MIKNLAIGGGVGLLFMVGGFFVGMRFVHVPVPKKATVLATMARPAPVASRDAISVDALRKTSEGMMDVNDALKTREQAVAAREKKAQQREDELDAERAALDRSHEKFHDLYTQFQQRLQLVNTNETDQLQRQLTIYTAMDPAEACDLIRSLDDGTIVRLFSMMDTKPLAALVSAWKGKYPTDSARLLTALTQMGKVMPEDKVALSDPATITAVAANAPTTQPISNGGPAPDAMSAPTNITSTDAGSSAPATTTDASAPATTPDSIPAAPAASDATASAATATTPDASTGTDAATPAAAPAPADAPSDASASPTATPAPATAPTDSPSAGAPAATPAVPVSPSDAAPAAAPLAPPADSATTPGSASATMPSDTIDTAQLGVPGETAAEAAEAAQRRTGRLSADISNDRAY